MLIKIHKRWEHPLVGWLPYLVIRTHNISKEEYAKMHAESDYKDYPYEIVEDN
jgi:hypothetical protein